MSYTISEVEEHLAGMLHGGTLNQIKNKYAAFERAANQMKSKVDVVTTMRTQPLTQTVHSDVYNYSVPSDFGKIIDLYPQASRDSYDYARRIDARSFDLMKSIKNKQLSIESEDGARFIRIDWDSGSVKTLAAMNSATNWSVVSGATNLVADDLFYISGNNSLRFDVAATGDGIKNTSLTAVDLSEWDEQATFFMYVYLPSTTSVNSVTARWGNDVSTAYWESTAQTAQADGTAFQTGWNLIKFPWNTATETGTVAPATIDSFQVTLDVDAALADVRVDNVTVSLGKNFEMKYYGAYLFQTSAGAWIRKPTTDTDKVMVDELGVNIFLNECLIAMAHQQEGEDSAFDIQFANAALNGNGASSDPVERMGLYAQYRKAYPTQAQPETNHYFRLPPRVGRGIRNARY